MRRERGFALLVVLWSVVLLAVIATGITASGRTEAQLAANLRAAARAEAAADGAVQAAAFHLLDPATPWQADGLDHAIDARGAQITLRISPESGKVNPNTASQEQLRALLQASGANAAQAVAVAEAIVQWRFPRTAQQPGLGLGLGGLSGPPQEPAPVQAYRAAGLEYSPPGAPFESLDELGLVLGMTPDLLDRLTPHLSIYNESDVDPSFADAVVRQALKLPPGPAPGTGPAVSRPSLVRVTARALTPEGGRFTRQAVLRLGRSGKGPLVRILAWSSG